MSITVTLTLAANQSGNLIQAGNTGPVTVTIPNSPATVYETSTASGSTLILVPQIPSPATWMRIIPPTSSSTLKYLMSASGDSIGYQISTTGETWTTIGPGMTSFILRANAVETLTIMFW